MGGDGRLPVFQSSAFTSVESESIVWTFLSSTDGRWLTLVEPSRLKVQMLVTHATWRQRMTKNAATEMGVVQE